MDIEKILDLHKKWLIGEPGGERANLSNADLRYADLSNANLRYANLSNANLSNADLSNADLRYADLSNADLSNADLRYANLSNADLRYADLSNADLSNADLRYANLRYADLRYADLRYANLSNANLSEADGLLSTIDYLTKHFERTNEGFIAYKTFRGHYNPPKKWVIQPGSIITENVNFDRCNDCGCGINVAPLEWVKAHYRGDIWKVLIRFEWLVGVCVPYHTDGKIRCERVELIEKVETIEEVYEDE